MKRLVLGIVGLVILTGCGSSPQVEVKRSMPDYIKCMNEQIKIHKDKVFENNSERDDYFSENCEMYRP